jgi:hypothetical protein
LKPVLFRINLLPIENGKETEDTMKTKTAGICVILLAVVLLATGWVNRSAQDSPNRLSQQQAVALVRTINTAEAETFFKTQSYASMEKLLQYRSFQEQQNLLVPTDAFSGTVKNYKLSLVASEDGKHYLVGLAPAEQKCDAALFSSESGVIYAAKPIGCPTL